MKRIFLFLAIAALAFGGVSCGDSNDYQVFIGTWGVERLDYDTLDYAGMPMEQYHTSYQYVPGDVDNGIEMIFRSDRTGETRDHAIDTLYVDDMAIYCPDTTLITRFTYSYLADEGILYVNVKGDKPYTYQTNIVKLDDNAFVYENEYKKNCIEKAWLVRVSNTPATKTSQPVSRPRRPGSLFSR